MATWPGTLPATIQSGATETDAEVSNRSKVNSPGPPRANQWTRTKFPSLHGEMIFTVAQKAIFEAFYKSDLVGGAVPFDGDLANIGSTRSYKFNKPPRFTPLGGLWSVEVELGVLP